MNSRKRKTRASYCPLTCEFLNAVVVTDSNGQEPWTAGPAPKDLMKCDGNWEQSDTYMKVDLVRIMQAEGSEKRRWHFRHQKVGVYFVPKETGEGTPSWEQGSKVQEVMWTERLEKYVG